MSELFRLKRIVSSWIGGVRHRKKRRISSYEHDDARMILNDLGLQMTPEALAFVADDRFRREDFLMQLYAAEEELGIDLIKDNIMLDPALSPTVYEREGKLAFTAAIRGEEYIVAEFDYPKA
jgi:hypothetical protein